MLVRWRLWCLPWVGGSPGLGEHLLLACLVRCKGVAVHVPTAAAAPTTASAIAPVPPCSKRLAVSKCRAHWLVCVAHAAATVSPSRWERSLSPSLHHMLPHHRTPVERLRRRPSWRSPVPRAGHAAAGAGERRTSPALVAAPSAAKAPTATKSPAAAEASAPGRAPIAALATREAPRRAIAPLLPVRGGRAVAVACRKAGRWRRWSCSTGGCIGRPAC